MHFPREFLGVKSSCKRLLFCPCCARLICTKIYRTILDSHQETTSKSIQCMKGMYRTKVRSLLVLYRSFSHRQYLGRYFARNLNFEWPFHIIALTRIIVQSFLHCSRLIYQNIPKRTQNLHEIYRFHYLFNALTVIYTTTTFIECSTN